MAAFQAGRQAPAPLVLGTNSAEFWWIKPTEISPYGELDDAMTVDEVAAEAGMAKASLYKLFTSKEELAGAAMVGVLDRALAFVDGLRDEAAQAAETGAPIRPLDQLKAVTCWA